MNKYTLVLQLIRYGGIDDLLVLLSTADRHDSGMIDDTLILLLLMAVLMTHWSGFLLLSAANKVLLTH